MDQLIEKIKDLALGPLEEFSENDNSEKESESESDSSLDNVKEPEPVEHPKSIEDLALLLKNGDVKIAVVSGAGLSTSAGIPDFRSSNGIYNMLESYGVDTSDMHDPAYVFSIDYFEDNPKPFYIVAKEVFYIDIKPTPGHFFLKLLHDKGLLHRIYTQNIDGLEFKVGFDFNEGVVIQCHGGMTGAHCIACNLSFDMDELEEITKKESIPKCKACEAYVKPDIVFFGEQLPPLFHKTLGKDIKKRGHNMVFVMGTTLEVQPVASIPYQLGAKKHRGYTWVPQVLFNMETVGNFDEEEDLCLLGKIDDQVKRIIELCGWEKEYDELVLETEKKLKNPTTK